MQIGVAIINDPAWAAVANVLFAGILFWVLRSTQDVMHPASPILGSDSWRIQVYFAGLLGLTLLLAVQTARLFFQSELQPTNKLDRLKVGKLES